MSVRKIGSIEVYTSDQNLSNYTRKEREQFVNELFKKEYQGKEIDYLLNAEEIKALINNTTRQNFRVNVHHGNLSETSKARNARYDIAFSGDYIPLVSNADYVKTNPEFKAGQNKNHKEDNLWHNFEKLIVFGGKWYKLTIHVREYNNKFCIHNTKLKETDTPIVNSVYDSLTNESQKSISSTNIIPQPDEYATEFMDLCKPIDEYDDIEEDAGSSGKDELEL